MLCRSVLAAALAAVLVPLVPASPAAAQGAAATAATAVTVFTVDRMDYVDHTPNGDAYTRQTPVQAVYADVTVAPSGNGVRLADASGAEVTLEPPSGTWFAPGTSFPVGATQSATSGKYGPLGFCDGSPAFGTGTATVTEATYAPGNVIASLAADVAWDCGHAGSAENVRASIRVASALPYELVRARVAGPDPRIPVGGTTELTVRVDNLGTAPATVSTPGAAYVPPGTYAMTQNGCAGVTLAPGEGCDVTLTFTAASFGSNNGWSGGQLPVSVEGYPRESGVVARLGGRVVPQPRLPVLVRAVQAENGVALLTDDHDWMSGGTTAYEIVRRDSAEAPWTVLATKDLGTEQHRVIGHADETIAAGATAEYAVRALGPLGASDHSAPVAATRPATPPVLGEVKAIVFDTDLPAPWPAVLDYVAENGGAVMAAGSLRYNTPGDGTAEVPVPYVAGPGTYAVGGAEPHRLRRDDASCLASGTLTVSLAVFDDGGRPVAYSADFAGTCDGAPMRYAARLRSPEGYRGLDVTGPGAWTTAVGSATTRPVTLTGAGPDPVTVGAVTVEGAAAGEYALTEDTCTGAVLARGATCSLAVRVLATAKGVRPATLAVAVDTPRGVRRVPLDAAAVNAPGLPGSLEIYRVVGRTRIYWANATSDGGAPLTGYRVHRATAGGPWTVLGTVEPLDGGYLQWDDETAVPGVTYTYAVTALNAYAESAKRTSTAVAAPRGEVVFTAGPESSDWYVYAQNQPARAPESRSARFNTAVDETDHFTPAVSPDGRTLFYAAPSARGYGIWRKPFGSGTPALVTSVAGHEIEPAVSPDGRTLAYTHVDADGDRSVWTVPAGGGTPKLRRANATDPTWDADSETLVVVDLGTALRLLRVAKDGTRTVITGTAYGRDPAISPDGRWLAFSRWSTQWQAWQLAVLPAAGGTTPKFEETEADLLQPEWRRDGKRLFVTWAYGDVSKVASYAWVGGGADWLVPGGFVTDGGTESGGVYRSVGLHLTSAPHVTGRTARIGFGVTAPAPGETFTCSLDRGTPVACVSPWTRTGLAAGRHTLVVRSTAPGLLDTVTAHTWTVDATPPTVTVSGPASAVTLRDRVATAYRASGAASYDVRYRRAPTANGYSAYAYPAAWQRTTATTASVPAKPGTEVCFSVRARDAYGNLSAWSADRCSAVPYDDRDLTATGWRRATSLAAFRGTLTTAAAAGRSAYRLGVSAARVYVVAQRCRGCGSVDVYVGSTYFGRVSLDGAAGDRVVFALPRRSAPVRGTLTLRTVTNAPVRIDGVAVLRR